MPRVFATLFTAIAVMALATGTAFAQYPPTATGGTTVSDATLAPGESLTVSGSGWEAGSSVTMTLFPDPVGLGTAAVSADGTFSASVTIPTSVSPGTHELRVSGTGADGQPRTSSTSLVIVGASSGSASGSGASGSGGSGSDLAATGRGTGTTAVLAVLLLGIGGGVLLMARRRSGAAAAEQPESETV